MKTLALSIEYCGLMTKLLLLLVQWTITIVSYGRWLISIWRSKNHATSSFCKGLGRHFFSWNYWAYLHWGNCKKSSTRISLEDGLDDDVRAIEWSPRSCDLTPCDFFILWAFLKDKVYKRNHRNLPQLQEAIREEARVVSLEECRKVCVSRFRWGFKSALITMDNSLNT